MEVVKKARTASVRVGRWEAHCWGFADREGGDGLGWDWDWEWRIACWGMRRSFGGVAEGGYMDSFTLICRWSL